MSYFKLYTILLISSIASYALGSTACNIKNPNDLLERFKTYHPQLLENNALVNVSDNLVKVAKQRPNPQFQAQGMTGEEIDGDINRISFSAMHTFELGGKRKSRINFADSRRKQLRTSIKDSNENILINAILKSYRLRQIKELIPIYEEAYQTFKKILKTKRKRRSLAPEEEVEKETLVLAANDFQLKVSRLKSEEISLGRHISLFIKEDCDLKMKVLPQKVKLDKDFNFKKDIHNYSRLQEAKNSLETAKRKLELEKSNTYPDLKIGPAFGTERLMGRSFNTVGVTLSMDLPLLNTNSGSKNMALEQIKTARIKLSNIERETSLDLAAWIEKYRALGDSLQKIATKEDLEKKHLKIEKLFRRGIISTAMIIESHRQLIEFAKTRYEFELGAVEALWNIHKINGTVFTETL